MIKYFFYKLDVNFTVSFTAGWLMSTPTWSSCHTNLKWISDRLLKSRCFIYNGSKGMAFLYRLIIETPFDYPETEYLLLVEGIVTIRVCMPVVTITQERYHQRGYNPLWYHPLTYNRVRCCNSNSTRWTRLFNSSNIR